MNRYSDGGFGSSMLHVLHDLRRDQKGSQEQPSKTYIDVGR